MNLFDATLGRLLPLQLGKDEILQDAELADGVLGRLDRVLGDLEQPGGTCLYNSERDQAHLDLNRERLEGVLTGVRERPSEFAPALKRLEDIDLVYATGQELGEIANALLHSRDRSDVAQAIADVTRALLVPQLSSTPRAAAFREQLDAGHTVAWGEILEHFGKIDEVRSRRFFGSDRDHDGCYLGEGGISCSRQSLFSAVPPVTPNGPGPGAGGDVPHLLVNGFNTPVDDHMEVLQTLANLHQAPFKGAHNAKLLTRAAEFVRAIQDTENRRKNPTIDTVRNAFLTTLHQGDELNSVGISHGAGNLVTGMRRAAFILEKAHSWDSNEVRQGFERTRVTTYGGANTDCMDGPEYSHYVLRADPVPFYFGVTRCGLSEEDTQALDETFRDGSKFSGLVQFAALVDRRFPGRRFHPGENHRIVFLDDGETIEQPHSTEAYLMRRLRHEGFLPEEPDRRTGTEG